VNGGVGGGGLVGLKESRTGGGGIISRIRNESWGPGWGATGRRGMKGNKEEEERGRKGGEVTVGWGRWNVGGGFDVREGRGTEGADG